MRVQAEQVEPVKVAVATDGDAVSGHFGHCQSYTIAELADGTVRSRELIANPGHQPGFLPGYLAELGVKCIVAGGMGGRARTLFDQHGVAVVVGVSGRVDATLEALARGELESGDSSCDHCDQ